MSYSYSTPIAYGTQAPLSYDGVQNEQQVIYRKPSAAPAVVAGCAIGLIGGSIIGANKKNPYMKNGVPTDTFTKNSYDKYMKKAPEDEKAAYEQCKEVIKKINKVKNTDELKTLLSNNSEASKEVSTALNMTTDEFLNNVTDANLSSNKATIKQKLEAANQTRFQNMKNEISRCWDSEKKKFTKPDDMSEDMFKAIKKTSAKVRSKFVAKYALIATAIGGAVGFVANKIVARKKAQQ